MRMRARSSCRACRTAASFCLPPCRHSSPCYPFPRNVSSAAPALRPNPHIQGSCATCAVNPPPRPNAWRFIVHLAASTLQLFWQSLPEWSALGPLEACTPLHQPALSGFAITARSTRFRWLLWQCVSRALLCKGVVWTPATVRWQWEGAQRQLGHRRGGRRTSAPAALPAAPRPIGKPRDGTAGQRGQKYPCGNVLCRSCRGFVESAGRHLRSASLLSIARLRVWRALVQARQAGARPRTQFPAPSSNNVKYCR